MESVRSKIVALRTLFIQSLTKEKNLQRSIGETPTLNIINNFGQLALPDF